MLFLVVSSLHEVTFFRESFAQRWKLPPQQFEPTPRGTPQPRGTPHPISAFLYSLLIHYPTAIWRCLTLIGSPQLYQEYLDAYEIWGVLPTLRLSSVADLGPERMRTQELLSIARTWQQLGLKPDFESDWTPNTLFQYVGEDDEIATLKKQKRVLFLFYLKEVSGMNAFLG